MENTEAPVVAFTNYKRTDNFEVSVTFRGTDIADVMKKLNDAIEGIKKNGGTPLSRNRTFPPKAEPKYVQGEVCPLDGGKLIEPQPGSNRPIKCENARYDFPTKTSSGCAYIKWPNQSNSKQPYVTPPLPVRDINEDIVNF